MKTKTKECLDCGKEKPLTEFYKMAATSDGLHRYCKSCCKLHRAAERVGKRDKKNGVSYRQFYRCKVDEGHNDADKSIKLREVYKKACGICALCKKYVAPKQASLDHKVPISKGGKHIKSNVQLTHVKCNKQKGDR